MRDSFRHSEIPSCDQRQGDRFRVACREENAKEWTDMGTIEAKMSPQPELWLTAYVTGGEVRATAKRFDVVHRRAKAEYSELTA